MKSVGETIREARKRAGLSQRALAALMKITPSFLNDIEHGARQLTDERLMAIPHVEIRRSAITVRLVELQVLIGRLCDAA